MNERITADQYPGEMHCKALVWVNPNLEEAQLGQGTTSVLPGRSSEMSTLALSIQLAAKLSGCH